MLQSFTLGEQDSGHLYNHQNTQTGVLDRLCWGSSHGMGLQDSSFHTLAAENPKAVPAQAKPGREDTTASTAW